MAKSKKGSNKAPDLLTQYRGETPPPIESLKVDKQGRTRTLTKAEMLNQWFKEAKNMGKPDGGFLGVEDKLLNPKDVVDSEFLHKKTKK